MGLLSNEYYQDLVKQVPQQPVVPAQPKQPESPIELLNKSISNVAQNIGIQSPEAQYVENAPKPLVAPGIPQEKVAEGVPIKTFGDISVEEQKARFGGEVGSAEYYAYKAENPLKSFLPQQILTSFGFEFPDTETWDKMSRYDQTTNLGLMGLKAGIRMITTLPREVVKTPIRFGVSVAQPWVNLAKGKSTAIEDIAKEPEVKLPWIGTVPTYWKTYQDAVDSGASPLAASVLTGSLALGDVTINASLGEAIASAFQPRGQVSKNMKIENKGPIQTALAEEQGKLIPISKQKSTNEYYSLPKTTAKNFGGSSKDTFLKFTPVGTNAVEVSVVRARGGMIPKTIDYVKSKLGGVDVVQKGDFGPEIKLQSEKIFLKDVGQTALEEVTEQTAQKVISSIPPKALKGFENKAITSEQMGNLDLIGRVNGVESSVRDAVVRIVTGKKTMGELTQAEYVKAAQTLASFNNLNKYLGDTNVTNIASQYLSPQRYWMRSFEEKTSLPLYSEGYVPMEEGMRLRDVFRDSYRNEVREIFGQYVGTKKPREERLSKNYASVGYGEERRLVKSYMEGNRAAITENSALDSITKRELVTIAEKLSVLYDKLGIQFGIPKEKFLQDYQPHIQNLGGVYQLYKEGQEIPKSLEFFAKFKRRGSLQTQVDDSLALFDIYVNAGSNTLFLDPVLKRVGSMAEALPKTVQNSLKSYVQEKMGYAGQLEEFLNNVGGSVGKKLGINVPDDIARQMTQIAMDTTYSGAMGLNPATVLRNSFQYDMMTYPRLGPKFYTEALQKALTKQGMKEVRDAGFLLDPSAPYGEALTKDITVGGAAVNLYRTAAQKTMVPFSSVEALNRARTYWQTKLQFEDVLSRYNSGKITWKQFENELDFNALSPIDRNIVRQRLIKGDIKGAFENLVREIIDETQFPYRKGASSRVTYGLEGKLGTQFSQWGIEFTHTLGRWVKEIKNGGFPKLIRWAAASATIQRSLQDTLGFDFSNSVFFGPFGFQFSPFIKTSIEMVNGINAIKQQNEQAINDSADEIVRQFKSLGVPAGLEIQRVNNFLKSYDRGPIGPNGSYGVYDSRGRLQYWTDFSDIFWQMFGFPTKQKEDFRRTAQELRNEKVNYGLVKERVLELYQQEKYDEANQLINDYGIKIGPNDFDQYYIPYTDRTFQSLPTTLKGQFAPKLYK